MEIFCTFESDSEALSRIFQAYGDAFSALDEEEPRVFFSSPAAFLGYLRAYLLLVGDTREIRGLLTRYLDCAETGTQDPGILFRALALFPSVLLSCAPYFPDERDFLLSLANRADEAILRAWRAENAEERAFGLAYSVSRMRLLSLLGEEIDRNAMSEKIADFNSRYYSEKVGAYLLDGGDVSPLISHLACAFGFAHDDAAEALSSYIVAHSFEVPYEYRLLAFDALYAEERYDALVTSVIEAGMPRTESGCDCFAPLVSLLEHIVGIDPAMHRRGISAAIPHLPSGVTVHLVLPSENGYVTYDLGTPDDDTLL